VKVFQDEEERLSLGSVFEAGGQAVKEAKTLLGCLKARGRWKVGEGLAHLCEHAGDSGCVCSHLSLETLRGSVRDIRTDDLEPWPERRGSCPVIAASEEHLGPILLGRGRQLVYRPCLADPWFACE
jgi:hypothetical protein